MISDHDLCLAAQTGDTQAADLLVRRHTGLAYRIADGCYLQGADRDDTRQEALLALYVAVVSFRPGPGVPFTAFAAMVVARRLRDAMSKASRRKHRLLTVSDRTGVLPDGDEHVLVDSVPDIDADPAVVAEQRAQLSLLVESYRVLTPIERGSLMGIASGRTYRAIAVEHGVREKAVDNAATRARVKLRALLEAA